MLSDPGIALNAFLVQQQRPVPCGFQASCLLLLMICALGVWQLSNGAFCLVEWKTNEAIGEWERQLAITRKRHSLWRTWQLIGRCLSLLRREFQKAFPV